MKVSELGEFGLIDLLAKIAPQGGPEHRMLAAIGDDAAAWWGDDSTVLATTDAMVEGVHFDTGTTHPEKHQCLTHHEFPPQSKNCRPTCSALSQPSTPYPTSTPAT